MKLPEKLLARPIKISPALMLCVIVSLITADIRCLRVAAAEEHDRIPEFFLNRPDQAHCVLQVQLTKKGEPERRAQLLAFLGKAFELTHSWRDMFIPVAVDYINYRSFYLVSFQHCLAAKSALGRPPLRRILPARSQIKVVPDNGFVDTTAKRLGFKSVAEMFRFYRSRYDLTECAVQVPIIDRTGKADVAIHDALFAAWAKYRLPVAEIWQVNSRLYLIFSSQCENKPALYSALLGFASEQKKDIGDELGTPTFSPSLREYVQSHGG